MYDHGGMNRFYRLVWSDAKGCYIPIPEVSQKRGKRKGGMFAALAAAAVALLSAATGALADPGTPTIQPTPVMRTADPQAIAATTLPTGGQVVGGSATIAQSGNTQTITQTSQNAAIDWQSFNIGADGKVIFNQPNASAIALNRVIGGDASKIYGVLQANGQVFLVNPNGVLFAKGSQVSAAAIMASTRDISVADFMAGKYRLSGAGNGAVINEGTLTAAGGGYIALVGAQVVNDGVLNAAQGDVHMVAANDVTIRLDTGGLDLTIGQGAYDALVANGGVIRADSGRIYLTADAFDALAKASVNNTGIIEASSVATVGGKVVLSGGDITLGEGSRIDASGATGGGSVFVGGGWQGKDATITNASTVLMAPDAVIDVSARQSGNGGTAVLWSEDRTGFYGVIKAQGGAAGGNGGKVETSGHNQLQAIGSVAADAANGAGGQWLLDPVDVTIAASNATGTVYNANYNPTADSTILASAIAGSLNGGTSVTITTGSTGTSAGNITVNADILKSSGNAATLTLLAAGDIAVNNQISSNFNRLNVVMTADSDNSGAGNITFGSGGKVLTNGGNFYAGNLTSSSVANANQKRGQDFTMAAGSLINVADTSTYGAGGELNIAVNGTVTLAASSLSNTPYSTTVYHNDGSQALDTSANITISAGSILTSNGNAASADILTKVSTSLTATTGDIGSTSNTIKVSPGAVAAGATLSVSNSGGSTHISQITNKAFSQVNLSVGSQASSVHDIVLLNDADSSGKGHIHVTTDGAGVVQIAANGINTAGTYDPNTGTGIYPVNVALSGATLNFASGSTDVGTGTFTANGTTLTGSEDGVADIAGNTVNLNGTNIGTAGQALELADNSYDPYYDYFSGYLNVTNSGGSTYLKSVNDGFVNITMSHLNGVGTHSMLFSGGDHMDFTTTASGILTNLISGGTSDGHTFGVTTGIDLSRRLRALNLTALNGDIIFGDLSVDMGAGSFTATIPDGNSVGIIAAQNTYNASNQIAQITSGDVSFSVQNRSTPSVTTIGANGKDIQVAKGVGDYNFWGYLYEPGLSVSTQTGDVYIHELTQDYLKTINISLGQANTAQTINIDLKGADDISFTDTGSLITLDATKVAVSGYNRGFSLSAGQREVRSNGNALTTGGYAVNASKLYLNGDIITDGGDINLSGTYGIDLLSSVRVDSNSDHLGYSGNISFGTSTGAPYFGTISATGGSRTLSLDSHSTDGTGGQISFSGDVDNRAGAYLAGLSLDSTSLDSGTGQGTDTYLGINSANIKLDGDFSAAGNVYVGAYQQPFVLKTAVSNSGNAGNITFGGDSLTHSEDYAATFDASTTFAGGNGGNVDLFSSTAAGVFKATTLTVKAGGGSGGASGVISLPAVTTSGAQTYTGSLVNLYGNLTSANAAMTLNSAARLYNSVTLTSGSGVMTLGNLSATAAGQDLTIGSTTDSSALSLTTNNDGGYYIDDLVVSSANTRALSLVSVATEGSQTYTKGAITLGTLSTNGGNINLSTSTSLGTASGNVSIDTDRAGGSNAAGQLLFAPRPLDGNGTLTIDTTADGGGANADLTLGIVGNSAAFSSIDIRAGSITASNLVKSSGNITIEARGANADISLNATNGRIQTTGTSNTIILAAGRNFLNNRSSNDVGIMYGAGSRYLVYSANPATSTEKMTGYSKHYNQTYTNGSTPNYAGSGNWFLYSIAPVISVSTNGNSVVYGSADPSLTLTSANYSGFIDGDTLSSFSGSQTLSLAAPGTLSSAGKRQVGTYAYALNGTLTDSLGYTYEAFNQDLTVTRASIAVTGLTAVSREYDGTTNVTLTGTPSAGAAQAGDDVTVDVSGITGSITDKNVGTNKSVAISGSGGLSGADAGNYQLTPPSGLTMDVTKKTLTVAGSTAAGKTYDGNAVATVTAGTLSGFVGSETVTATGSGTFADKNAGTGKSVNATYALADGVNGGLAGNYQLAGEILHADIARKTLTVTGSTVTGKTYDGNTSATVTAGTLSGFVGSETVTTTGSGTFADQNAGTGKTVATTYALSNGTNGGLASNYQLADQNLAGDITRKTLSISGSTVTGKTYDGNTSATVTAGTLSGFVGSETVTATASGTFADKDADTGKTVATTYALSNGTNGGLASNYQLADQNLTGNIAKKTLTISGSTVTGKTYDGNASASITAGTLSGLVGSETVTATASGTFADKAAATGKSVVTTYALSNGTNGGLARNYQLAGETLLGDIAKKVITLIATGQNKTYNGSDAIAVTVSSNDILNGDTVAFTGTGAASDKNAGTGKTVTVSGITSSSADAGNYDFATTTTTTADIARKTIVVAATGQNKTYDGSTSVDVSLASSGVLNGDAVVFTGTGATGDKNAGLGKTVSVSGIAATGSDADNYAFNTTAATTADIARKTITVAATGQNKTYDGSTSVGVTLGSAGIVNGDTVSFTGTGAMTDKNAGSGKTVAVSGIASTSADAGNYNFASTASTTVDVAQKVISVTATGQNKTYDGSASVGVTLGSTGILNGDTVAFTGTGAASDKNAGTGKTVTVSGIASTGTDAGNYDFASTASTTVDIAKKAVSVTATGQNKTYDGSAAVDVILASSGIVNGDTVAFSGTGTASDKNAGHNKTVTIGNFTATGADADNYDVTAPTAATVDIARKAITVAATGQNKTYDGSASVGVDLSSAGIVAGDTVAFSGTGTASDKNAGLAKTVAISSFATTGTDAGNYDVATPVSTTVDIAKKVIAVTAAGQNKTYDGSTAVGVDLASSGIVAGDTVAFSGTGTAFDKNAGTGKTVAVTGIAATGADADNYAYASEGTTTVDVARKSVTVIADGVAKTYDGTSHVDVALSSNGIVAGDTVVFSGIGTASDKNAGTGKTVAVTGIAGTGTDADNYAYNTQAATTADIAKKTVDVRADGIAKTYDGTSHVDVTLSSNDIVAGDRVAFSGTGTAADKNAGTGKSVAVTNISASGSDSGNYAFASTGSTTVDIAKKAVTVDAAAQGKTYDGSASVGVALSSNGIVAGDSVTFSGTGLASDKNAGVGKSVTVSQIAASGTDAGNYAYGATASTTVDIAARDVSIVLQGPISKTGDGSTAVALTTGNYQVSGLVAGEAITVNQTAGQFADAMAGKDKTVTAQIAAANYIAGPNTDLSNYKLTSLTLTTNVGEIISPTSPGYDSALASIITAPVVTTSGPAVSTGDGNNTVATTGEGGQTTQPATITPVDSHEALTFRRTFAIADGGIRLPDGVSESDGDTGSK